MWELDCEESWAPKNWCFWTVVLEKILESPLDCKEIQPVHSKVDQPWDFFGRNDAKAETPVFGHLMWRVDSLGKTLMLGGIGGRRKRGRQRIRWLNGITTQWTWVWVNSGKWWWTGSLACCDSWGHKESDMTEQLNWIELNWIMLLSQPDFKPFWAQMWFLQLSLEITVENKYLLNNSRVGNLYLIQWLYNNSYFSPQVNLYFIEHIISPFIIESLQGEDVGWITNSFKNYRKKTEWESLFIGSINIIYM